MNDPLYLENSNIIGVSSGASAPEILVENFIKELKNKVRRTDDRLRAAKEQLYRLESNSINDNQYESAKKNINKENIKITSA